MTTGVVCDGIREYCAIHYAMTTGVVCDLLSLCTESLMWVRHWSVRKRRVRCRECTRYTSSVRGTRLQSSSLLFQSTRLLYHRSASCEEEEACVPLLDFNFCRVNPRLYMYIYIYICIYMYKRICITSKYLWCV